METIQEKEQEKSALHNITSSPVMIRVAPFVLFLVLTSCQGLFGEESKYWIYLAKTLVGVWLIWLMRPFVREMRWSLSWEAVVMGVAVFVIWITLGPMFRMGKDGEPWNPFVQFGEGSMLGWTIVIGRILGSTLVVPPLEEVFYRSFVYRYLIRPAFESIPLNHFHKFSFVVTALIFGFVHREWLAGILCAFAYQWLVIRKNRLGDAMTAHAITNFLLGLWVVWKGAWHFW